MKYRRLGKTDLRVSVVGFGSWQFGGEWGKTFTVEEAESLLSRARDRGINLIDTAECYGDGLSEQLIGRAIAGHREAFVIATKFGHRYDGLFERTPRWRAAEVVQQLEASLRNLRTDYIDLYQAHSPRDEVMADDELWPALAKQVDAGKIRHIGLSIWNNDALAHAEAASRLGIEAIQVVYNRLDRTAEKRLFASCERQDLGVLARVPLASGFLSGKFKPGADTKFSPDEVRGRWFSQQEVDKKIADVDEIRRSEVPPGVDMASWSLAFCLHHPGVTCKLTGDHQYIEQAFSLDEENKANTLSLYLQESKLKARSSIPPSLLQQETALKKAITRLSLAVSGEKDSLKIVSLNGQLNEAAINLFKVQKKIDGETNFGRLKFLDENVSVRALQKIIPSKSAIMSYHIGDTSIICFVITDNKFDFFSARIPASFNASLKELYAQAQLTDGNDRKKIKVLEQYFYQLLVKPAEQFLAGKKDLMIIPDDELNYLPFEIITDNRSNILLSQFSITYNYSCSILQNSTANTSNLLNSLGMAPFAESTTGPVKTTNEFSLLPASKREVQTLNGTALFNKQATKQKFLKNAGNFNIIHLATHAYANDQDPNKSFIAFYPTKPDSAINFKLYLPEIYDLKLDKTRLVVLSACESGVGELIKGEGLISLSRAFSYSGCDNIITSMWKADDASTAYISERLHFYLQKGATIAYALQQAKLDYLNDDHIATAQKLPGYWAHFRLIGNFEGRPGTSYWLIYLGAVLLLGLVIIINQGAIKKLIMPRLKN